MPIHIPHEWDDDDLILFEEFCDLFATPQRTVRDWRLRGVGPCWRRFNGCGRLYTTVAEARRFLRSVHPDRDKNEDKHEHDDQDEIEGRDEDEGRDDGEGHDDD